MLLLLAAGIAYRSLTSELPSIAHLPVLLDSKTGLLLQPTQIYDRSGTHLLYTFDNPGIPRRFLPIDPAVEGHLDAKLVQTVVALEQPDYWLNSGAAWGSAADSQPQTLAEKLVDALLLDGEPAGLRRSLRMRFLAAQIVGEYGHAQVLEWYLNSASFGHLTIGADNAARLYLGKSAARLDMGEVAVLLAALNAPALNPIDAPAAALENQRTALMRLLENGIISSEEYLASRNNPPSIRTALEQPNPAARAFSSLVINQLSDQFGRRRLERGGLRVVTTLNYDLQVQLSCTLRTQLARLQGRSDPEVQPGGIPCEAARLLPTFTRTTPWPAALAASAVITDPASGQILAYVGDSTLSAEQPTQAAHEPGTSLSPFLAVTAFVRGFSPASLVWDIPPVQEEDSSQIYHGPVRLRVALANDYLAAETSLLNQIGPATVWRSVDPFGLRTLSADPDAANLLSGGGSLTPLELAHAYGIFANQGVSAGVQSREGIPASVSILTVEDSTGRVLLDQTVPAQLAVLSPQLAYLVHHVISDEAARWPSLGYPNPLEIGRPAGARVGRLLNSPQVWTAGYTRRYSAVVWLGLPASQSVEPLDARLAAGIWHAVMLHAESGQPVEDWSAPAGITRVEVCDPSGLLPGRACPNRVTEVFLTGNEPNTVDTLYRTVSVNRETGRLATVFTPLASIEERTYMIVPPEASAWARQAELEAPPSAYDAIQAPQVLADVNITLPELFSYVRGEVSLRGTAAGDAFKSFKIQVGQGIQPQAWLQVGDEVTNAVKSGTLGTWDTRKITDGLYAVRLQVLRSNAQIDTAVIQVTVDNTAPFVQLNYPADGQTFRRSQTTEITLLASAQDAVGIQRVEWLLDGTLIGERGQAPYTLPLKLTTGTHTLECVAYDLAGNRANSTQTTITVTK